MPARRAVRSSEFDNCPCSGVSLDRLVQPAILTILAQKSLHGYLILQGIAEIEGRKPDATGVYRALRSMEARGLVVSEWDAPASGPARKSYRITAAGLQCLERWVHTLDRHGEVIYRLIADARCALGLARRPSSTACGPRGSMAPNPGACPAASQLRRSVL